MMNSLVIVRCLAAFIYNTFLLGIIVSKEEQNEKESNLPVLPTIGPPESRQVNQPPSLPRHN